LLEKEQTTPDYYPLTLNALISACNQTTNRNPVMVLKRFEVLAAIHELEKYGLVQRVTGPRADRWRHVLIQRIVSEEPKKAILTILLLRGAQTIGELKGRTDRMHPFAHLEQVEETLLELASSEPPLVRELAKQPGQKESRWELNLSQQMEPVIVVQTRETDPDEAQSMNLEERVRLLEQKLEEVLSRLESLEKV
jgi:uncharacterized protein YceH (UPF0502 family)